MRTSENSTDFILVLPLKADQKYNMSERLIQIDQKVCLIVLCLTYNIKLQL